MKSWFLQLPRREQYLLLLAVLAVILLILVNAVWRPLIKDVATLEKANSQLVEDAAWMQSAVTRYQALRSSGGPMRGSTNLSARINNTLAAFKLKLNRFQPGQDDSAQVWLENVAFDQLVLCIAAFENKGITVESVNISAVDQPGLVRAKLKLAGS